VRPARRSLVALVGLLAALTVAWAALPAAPGPMPLIVLIIAAVAAASSVGVLAVQGISVRRSIAESVAERLQRYLVLGLRGAPWAEVTTVAALVLEAEHAHQPWHTGVLLIALLSYLTGVHLAETSSALSKLRAQLPPLAVGAGLAVIALGAGTVRGLPAGDFASVVRVIAAAAAVAAVGLAIPVWLSRKR
jgi:hypothetical protein